MEVFIIQHSKTFIIHGCFDSLEKAKKYISESNNLHISKLEVN